jgi:carbon-monoxide dehydrogenase large subunit
MAGTDTGADPYGGGAWASRGMALGGEAALHAARELRARILRIAGAMLQAAPETLALADGSVHNAAGLVQVSLAEIADAAHFLPDSIPLADVPSLTVAEAHVPRSSPWFTANGVQAAYVEIDVRTGAVRLLGFWVVEDCGRVINPLLADGQIRGGVAQGIGAALFEQVLYSAAGQLQNGSLAEYLLPMAAELPTIDVAHVSTPERSTELGAKGAGEAGTVAAAAAIRLAVNDALGPLGVAVSDQPFSPHCLMVAISGAAAGAVQPDSDLLSAGKAALAMGRRH